MDTPRPVKVRSVEAVAPRDRLYWLDPIDAPTAAFLPGQYVMLTDPEAETPKARAYSFASAPGEGPGFRLAIRYPDAVEADRWAYEEGQVLHASDPAGSFTLDLPERARLVLLAAGSGVTPFVSYLGHLAREAPETDIHLVQCDRTPESLLLAREIGSHAESLPNLTWTPTLTQAPAAWEGRQGRIDDALRDEVLAHPRRCVVHACGPFPFVDAELAAAQARGVDATRCRREAW